MPPAVSLAYLKALCQKDNPPLWTQYEHIRALNFGCVMTWDQNWIARSGEGGKGPGAGEAANHTGSGAVPKPQ